MRARRQHTDAGFGEARGFAAGLAFELSGAGVVARPAPEYLRLPLGARDAVFASDACFFRAGPRREPARAAISMTSAFRTNPTVYYWCISFLLGVHGAWGRIAVSGRARDPEPYPIFHLSFLGTSYLVYVVGSFRRVVFLSHWVFLLLFFLFACSCCSLYFMCVGLVRCVL